MPALSTAEHQRVRQDTRALRNAMARRRREQLRLDAEEREARAWCEALGATVRSWPYHGETLHEVRVPGFHSCTAVRLAWAVAHLDGTIAAWLEGEPRATHGPTGAKLDRLREARAQWETRG